MSEAERRSLDKLTSPRVSSVSEATGVFSIKSGARTSLLDDKFLIDNQLVLSMTRNGRNVSFSSAGRRKKKRKSKGRRKATKTGTKKPSRGKKTVMRRVPIASATTVNMDPSEQAKIRRRQTRGKFQDKAQGQTAKRIEFIFKDAIENTTPDPDKPVAVDVDGSSDESELEDFLGWTQAKGTANVLELIAKGSAEAIQAISCGIDAAAVQMICSMLEKTDNVKKLSFAGNKIGDVGCLALKELLDKTKKLTYIHLWGNNIGDVGADTFADALKDNSTLTYLILSKNGISDLGAESLCEGLTYNTTLEFLDVGENCMADDGAFHFADMLKTKNHTLKHLDLSDNGITMEGAKELAASLKFNSSLEELTLAFNEVTSERTDQQLQSIGWMMFSQ